MSFHRYEQSQILNERAKKVLVGGVNSPVRSFRRVGGKPILASRAEGAYLWDIDNNKYIDCVMSYGPHLFGHAHPSIVEALKKHITSSTCYGMTTEAEVEWAELLLKRFPHYNKVRSMSTGTEACATAIRLARAYTGKDKILKFSGHYHGHVDSLMVAAGSGLATLATAGDPVPDSAGIPQALTQLAVVGEFNNSELLEKIFQRHGNELACVILEPIMGNMGVIAPQPEFLRLLRELTRTYDCLLIFDEVMTGLRVHWGSAQALYGIEPDLTCLGKVVGGGLPLSAVVGPQKIMDYLSPLGQVYQAGTLSGNPLSVQAGIAMMKLIDKEDPYSQLEIMGAQLEQWLNDEISHSRLPMSVARVGSMISLFCCENVPQNDQDVVAGDSVLFQKFFWAMADEGFMLPPSPFEAWFLSIPHLKINVDDWKRGLRNVFEKIRLS